MRGARHNGQVFMEYAISLIGLVVLIYVVLKVWLWLNSAILLRQASFQGTRVKAGTPSTAGTPVPYMPEPLTFDMVEDIF